MRHRKVANIPAEIANTVIACFIRRGITRTVGGETTWLGNFAARGLVNASLSQEVMYVKDPCDT
jgi:hypothetical protein